MKKKLFLAVFALLTMIGVQAQTDVTSTYLTNADFEGEYSVYTYPREDGDNKRAIYQPNGWTVTYTNGEQNDMSCLNGNCLQWSQFSGLRQLSRGGSNTYWSRLRFGANTKLTLSQVASSVPAGTYCLTVDAYKNTNNGEAKINVAGKTTTIDARSDWATYSIVFTLTETSNVTITYSFEGKATDTRTGVDNFKLFNITQGASDLSDSWTSMIANASFENGTEGSFAGYGSGWADKPVGYSGQLETGWTDGSIKDTNPKDGSKCYNLWSNTFTSSNIYQDVILPKGKYVVSAALRIDNMDNVNDQGVYAKIGENTYKSGTITSVAATWDSFEGWNTLDKVFYVTEDNTTVRLGVSSTGTGSSTKGWYQLDNFTLTYKGAVQNTTYSITQGTATAVTNDKWYAVTVPIDGKYRIISSVDNTVYYTQNGYYAPSDATSLAVTAGVKQVVNLTEGTLYVLAANDATLTVEPDVYAYSVSAATSDMSYIQSGNTVTVSYTVKTNNPSASLTQDYSGVTFDGDAVACTATASGFTFTVPGELTTNTAYTLAIPAGAIGYAAGSTYNTAQNITLTTPALFDGAYYLKKNDADKYISRGGDSNTEAALDNYGIAVRITTDGENVTHFTFVDNNKNLFGGSQTIYTDKNESDLGENAARARWTLTQNGGGYNIYSPHWSKYIAPGTGAESGKPAATYSDVAYAWTFEAPATHATKMAALKDTNAATVATAAGISATTVEGLKTIITGDGWETENITLSNTYSSIAEKYQEFGTIVETQNLTELENGIYKVTFHGFHRLLDNENTYTLYQNDMASSSTYLKAGNQELPFPSVMSESSASAYTGGWMPDFTKDSKHYPNNTTAAGQAFTSGKYTLEVFAYVSDGTLSISAEAPGKYTNSNWICYRDLSLTLYKTIGDYTALNTAILAAETHTLGFGDGEYAPYNNVAALEALAAAKTLYATRNATEQDDIDAVTTALTSATWIPNDGDVDIVYNGNFAIANGNNPKGWTRSNSAWGQQITGLSEATNGVDAGTTTAWYYNTEGAWEYGKDGVYTMPLKGNTVYLISFKYRSHSSGSNNWMKASITPVGGETQDLYKFPQNADDVMFYGVTAGFKTSTAGNYILSLTQSGNTHLTDVSIVEASSCVAVTLGTNGYATFASPYALDLTALPTGVKAYKAAVDGENVNFTRVDDQSVPAYTGVLLAGTASQDVDINVAASSTAVEDNAFKVNVFGRTFDAAENTKYFGLKANTLTFGLFNPESVAIPNNKAYLTTTTTSARLVISFEDEDPMAINAIEAAETKAEGLKDGKYLIGNKIVLVKNGVKFNANGQILK